MVAGEINLCPNAGEDAVDVSGRRSPITGADLRIVVFGKDRL